MFILNKLTGPYNIEDDPGRRCKSICGFVWDVSVCEAVITENTQARIKIVKLKFEVKFILNFQQINLHNTNRNTIYITCVTAGG